MASPNTHDILQFLLILVAEFCILVSSAGINRDVCRRSRREHGAGIFSQRKDRIYRITGISRLEWRKRRYKVFGRVKMFLDNAIVGFSEEIARFVR